MTGTMGDSLSKLASSCAYFSKAQNSAMALVVDNISNCKRYLCEHPQAAFFAIHLPGVVPVATPTGSGVSQPCSGSQLGTVWGSPSCCSIFFARPQA